MRQTKPMRGYWWYILLFCAIVVILTCVLNLCGVKQLGMDSTLANIAAIIIAGSYITAYFVLPKVIRSKAAEAASVQASENVPLKIPAQIRIVRDSSVAGAMVPYIIYLNGQQVCSLNNGCSEMITITMKQNVLMTNAVGSSKVRYEFEARDGASGEIHVKGGVFLPKTMKWMDTEPEQELPKAASKLVPTPEQTLDPSLPKPGEPVRNMPATPTRDQLIALWTGHASPDDRIRMCIAMQPSVSQWSDAEKSFYYLILGNAIGARSNWEDEHRFPFFAASVFYNPINTNSAWHDLYTVLDGSIGPATAQRMFVKYPLPEDFSDLLN